MRFRKLRIAWSVTCGVVAVLLIVLWVRSYRYIDSIHVQCANKRVVLFESFAGRVGVADLEFNLGQRIWMTHTEIPDWKSYRGWKEIVVGGLRPHGNHVSLVAPHWCVLLMVAACALLPWYGTLAGTRRFSLRTLLIATTLVAVVLGLIVWLR
jgi:hypothetical protein